MCKESLIDFDKYEITNDGKIFSKYKNDYIYGTIHSNGYIETSLKCIDGKKRPYPFHRVIWYYFNGDIPEGMQVNHIDECKTNNALSNLNLMTPEQNSNWGTRTQRMVETKRIRNSNGKPLDQIELTTGEVIKTWKNTMDVQRELGYNNSHISQCCKGGYYRK